MARNQSGTALQVANGLFDAPARERILWLNQAQVNEEERQALKGVFDAR
jgi:hypothetical protein